MTSCLKIKGSTSLFSYSPHTKEGNVAEKNFTITETSDLNLIILLHLSSYTFCLSRNTPLVYCFTDAHLSNYSC